MSAAVIGLIGVVVGGLLAGLMAIYGDNSGRTDRFKEALIARLDRLLADVGTVDSAVQTWTAFGALYQQEDDKNAPSATRFLEEAGKAAGAVATACIAVRVVADDVGSGHDLSAKAKEFVEAARATTRELPGKGLPADVAYPKEREALVQALSDYMARVREQVPSWRDRTLGRFTPPK